MVAMYDSVVLANNPSKPGKPGWLNGSVIGWPARSFSVALPSLIAGLTYFAPNSPLYPS
jgi:hypothetical protein